MRLSGDQIEIVCGRARAVVTTVGATLRTYAIGDRSIVEGFGADEISPGGRGQVLVPWPNRVAGGRYVFAGKEQVLPIDEPSLGHAIHGLVRWAEWRAERPSASTARFHHTLCARPGYPFPLELSVEYRLASSGLAVSLRAINVGAVPCPFGAGAHPYFHFAGVRADELELAVPAKEWLEVDERSIPLARRGVAGSSFDFRQARAIGPARLDHAFVGLERDRDGVAQVLLRHGSAEVRVWQDAAFDWVQVYTGDTLPDRARRRTGVAIEPTSCAPNAFNSGDGLRVLAPGEVFEGRWGVHG